ncbi:MAG: rRNA maturation RNase YbeY [Faecalibacillus sp.]
MEIDLAIINELDDFHDNYEDIYLRIIEEAKKQLDIEDDLELSVIFVSDEKIHEINRDYRNIDRSTDVISFALEDNEQYYMEGMPRELGDIFISVDHAKLQAEEFGHSFYREMCFLFTHGLLHLLGYDHMEKDDEKEMFALQDQILDALEIGRDSIWKKRS